MPEIDLHHSVVIDEDQLLLGKVKDMSWENDSVLVIVDSNQDGSFISYIFQTRRCPNMAKSGRDRVSFCLLVLLIRYKQSSDSV
ncbi:MAG: hypothetical protein ACLUGY_21255 [Phocaeicola massiliensis]